MRRPSIQLVKARISSPGFESEFIGRLPVIAIYEKLEIEDLYAILKNPNNPIILGKKKDFKSYGIDIQFEDEALHALAVKAYEEKTGARGLVSAVEKVLLKFEKRLPSTTIRNWSTNMVEILRRVRDSNQDPLNPEILPDLKGSGPRKDGAEGIIRVERLN
jgi:ATP-dependent protease Clp ATPase subunit